MWWLRLVTRKYVSFKKKLKYVVNESLLVWKQIIIEIKNESWYMYRDEKHI